MTTPLVKTIFNFPATEIYRTEYFSQALVWFSPVMPEGTRLFPRVDITDVDGRVPPRLMFWCPATGEVVSPTPSELGALGADLGHDTYITRIFSLYVLTHHYAWSAAAQTWGEMPTEYKRKLRKQLFAIKHNHRLSLAEARQLGLK